MSVPHGCSDDTAVVEDFMEALKHRVGADRYRMWFTHGVSFSIDSTDRSPAGTQAASNLTHGRVMVWVRGQFALDRLRKNFLRELRGAAMQACGSAMDVQLQLEDPPAKQSDLPLDPTQDVTAPSGAPPNELSPNGSLSKVAERPRQQSAPTFRGSSRVSRSRRHAPNSLSKLVARSPGLIAESPRVVPAAAARPESASPRQVEIPSAASRPARLASTGAAATPTRSEATGHAGRVAADAIVRSSDSAASADQARDSPRKDATVARPTPMTAANFVVGPSNQLAHTAMVMVSQNPGVASPLFLCGPSGCGKSHLLASIADQLRRRHRLRRVMHLSAEQFTNDFISSVGNSGITSFRRRYREVDALLIDDVQFLGAKKATLREMLYTVETLTEAGRPLVFSGLQSPTEIPGLSRELAGRMAAGLVCPVQPIDMATRETIFRRWLEDRCALSVPDVTVESLVPLLAGDGRVISGVVNMVNTLQRMHGRTPNMDELRRFCGELLRASKPVASLSVIETAVCETFHLPPETLRAGSQTRAVTEPRMLAMYLSRQLTSSAYAEIAKHYGGKSHSTAIAAEKNVKKWLGLGKSIGRGHAAMGTQEAIDRIENLLRSG